MEMLHGYALPFVAEGREVYDDVQQRQIVIVAASRNHNEEFADYAGAKSLAQLFSAAPELADALKELLCWLGSGSALSNGAKCEMLTEATDQARAALHKAGVA